MNFLVTGAAGFIGRCLVRRLKRSKEKFSIILSPRNTAEKIEGCETFFLDLSGDPGSLERAVLQKPDVVLHLAAAIPPAYTGELAAKAASINRRIDEHLFAACINWGARMVYASSTSIYGHGLCEIKTEDGPINPAGPYAEAKLDSEKSGARLLSKHNLPFSALRISAPYGTGQRTKTVMNVFIERAVQGLSLMYHGSGSRQQDFTHVEDVAESFFLAARSSSIGSYNIAGGHPISMKQLAELIITCVPGSHSRVAPSGEADAQEGVTAHYSTEKALAHFGWQPNVPLSMGIKLAVESFGKGTR